MVVASPEKISSIDVAEIRLVPYYIIGVGATTVGILIVVVLNFFTPLDLVQTRIVGQHHPITWETILTFYCPRLFFVLGISYLLVISGINGLLKPISECLDRFKKGDSPDKTQIESAQRRVLNFHFLFIPVNIILWLLISCFLALSAILAGVADNSTVIIFSARASMVGLIASAIASQRMEAVSRRQLIPFFFPEGQLTKLHGVKKISISKRIRIVNQLSAIIPVTILLVTLVTLQWELEIAPVPSIIYGRGVILFTFVLFIYTILFSRELNRLLGQNIVGPINDLVSILQDVQKGQFNGKVQIMSNDEIGYAGEVVNEMTLGLQEKKTMQRSLALASEIQQNLLPKQNPEIPGLDIAATLIYCDETGGDYYDFLLPENDKKNRIRIVMGDVSGHGISSALIMATSRALFRQRSAMQGDIGQVVSDVNHLLCRDVNDSGNFMTLFCVEIDMEKKYLKWVRAGHDPAMLYDSKKKMLVEMKGEGIALGVDDKWQYSVNEIKTLSAGHVIVLFTDGIWEIQNFSGERFGKKRLLGIIEKNAHLSSQLILESVIYEFNRFQKGHIRQDDATLIIVKLDDVSVPSAKQSVE